MNFTTLIAHTLLLPTGLIKDNRKRLLVSFTTFTAHTLSAAHQLGKKQAKRGLQFHGHSDESMETQG